MPEPLRLIDLFAGAGGMTAGFRATGCYDVVQAVEMDRMAAATYALNHGAEHLHVGDIADWLEHSDVPAADVIIGGPPCQGFSALGRQDVHDVRNSLWKHYATTIARARPKIFVLENVARFLSSPQFADLLSHTEPGQALSDYTLQSFVVNAADYGAAQARRRAVVIGRLRSLPALDLPPPLAKAHWRTVRDAFQGVSRDPEGTALPTRTFMFGELSVPGPYMSTELHVGRTYSDVSLRRFASIPPGGNRHNLPVELLARCWVNHKSGSGDVMGRLHWDRPSVTIRTEFFKPEKGRYLHPEEDRALSHREAARLQGFADDYLWAGSKVAIARQIGNAVPIPLAEMLARLVASTLTSENVS